MSRNSPQWDVVVSSVEQEFRTLAQFDNHVQYEREAKFALQAIQNSQYLQKCSTESIRNAVLNVAAIGITLNPALKLAYLVPRDGLCCLDISYQGLVKIATDSGSVLAAKAVVVRENDEYVDNGPFEKPTHQFNPFATNEARGKIVGVYAMARLPSGIDVVETMNREAIDKIRSKSKAANGPWKEWEEEMIKKTAIKRGYKSWPKTERLSRAEQVLNEHEGLVDNTIDITPPPAALPRAPHRQRAIAIAEQANAPQDTPERQELIAKLEKVIKDGGQDAYAKRWAKLTGPQKRLVGKEEHERLWASADPANAQPTEAGDAAAA